MAYFWVLYSVPRYTHRRARPQEFDHQAREYPFPRKTQNPKKNIKNVSFVLHYTRMITTSLSNSGIYLYRPIRYILVFFISRDPSLLSLDTVNVGSVYLHCQLFSMLLLFVNLIARGYLISHCC